MKNIISTCLIFGSLLITGCQDYNSNTFDKIKYDITELDDEGDSNFASANKIIVNNCAYCHEHSNWGTYTNSDWLDSGFINKGDPDNSYLIIRTKNYGGSDSDMPEVGEPLTDEEYQTLRTWITEIP